MIENNIIETVVLDMQNLFSGSTGYFSETRDIFTSRIQSYAIEKENYLEIAVIGEIGNNTFDHNFGFVNEFPKGVYCNTEYLRKYTVLADYGKGLRQSLIAVMPSINSDMEAIEIAFTKRISGRSPEQRGNGLKFVSETVRENNWHLYFQSGVGSCSIDKDGIKFTERKIFLTGCLAIIDFDGGK
jgi:hypothetical protein